VSAAFLQGRKIDRTVYVEPPKEFKKPGMVWRLRKGLYGLREASRLWFEELSADLEKKGGQKLLGDEAVFLFFRNGEICGIVCVHVDDIIAAGDDIFHREIVDEIKRRFKISKDQEGTFTYTGMAVWTDAKGQVHLNQNKYIEEMEEIPTGLEDNMTEDQCKSAVRQAVGKLLYLNLTRPDIAFKINMLSRLTPGEDQKDKVKQARSLIEEVKKTKVEIVYGSLGKLNSLYLEIHADASFGNVDDKTKSTEGAVVILRGSEGTGSPIYWRSNVIARVCKSAKSAETCALEDAIDTTINIGRQVHQIRTGEIADRSCKIVAMTDSKGLIDSLGSTKQVSEGRMRLNVHRIKEYLRLKEVAKIKWVPTTHMLADSLTKSRADPSKLIRVLETGKME